MKILTAAQMREVDRLTVERGIPSLILMENAGSRVVDFLLETFAPLVNHRVAIVCGKGNNAGDGFVVARQLFTRHLCRELTVIELFDPAGLNGDAAANRRMLAASGCPVQRGFENQPQLATLVVDAILGTGLTGPVKEGPALDGIHFINQQFPLAQKVSIDVPSGQLVQADYTVTFVAPKPENLGKFTVANIGTPPDLVQSGLNLSTPGDFRHLFAPRPADSNKGMYGHVLVVGGSFGKSGAPAMSGLGAYRSGAGLVTVALPKSALSTVAAVRPELMTEPLEETSSGHVRFSELSKLLDLAKKMTVLAVGPGLGTEDDTVRLVKALYEKVEIPAVFDADALNALAPDLSHGSLPHPGKTRILTPHPGEMSRLTGKSVKEVQAGRLAIARAFAHQHNVTVVLKGDRTVIAFPEDESIAGGSDGLQALADGSGGVQTWINPTGAPSMATGGTGDILTGMISGMVAQHPKQWQIAVVAAVWLHGRCGELGQQHWGQEAMLATDLLNFLPAAIDEARPILHH